MGERLGQYFLRDRRSLRRIARATGAAAGDTIVEIGPGHGELTRELLKTPGVRVIAIEKDHQLAALLKKNFQFLPLRGISRSETISNLQTSSKPQTPNIEVVEGDALNALPKLIRNLKLGIRNSDYLVVGNIPYYLTGRLLRTLSELELKPTRTTLTVQKEVAERICAGPPRMNLLAASVQFWAEPSIVSRIPRRAFSPAPKVDSAVLVLHTKKRARAAWERYYRLIRALFKHPRKTILNNLREKGGNGCSDLAETLRRLGIDPQYRPQNLSLEDLMRMSESVSVTSGQNSR
jgi:16S rRNA (adenine1518-N6/adenine1519-N6)-dimethyltransferase